ncbi:MAG TPA: hypothetical protein PLI09_18350 [Candidatus Hydrogenedentes bacterium]|nr:hypothetical protein [Candidatus Hydrogenedentota bacterium]
MSYLEMAKRAAAQAAADGVERFEERAAIMEYDAGMPRADAEAAAIRNATLTVYVQLLTVWPHDQLPPPPPFERESCEGIEAWAAWWRFLEGRKGAE